MDRRTAAMEERLNKFEALVSVLPVWKEDLVRQITCVSALGMQARRWALALHHSQAHPANRKTPGELGIPVARSSSMQCN